MDIFFLKHASLSWTLGLEKKPHIIKGFFSFYFSSKKIIEGGTNLFLSWIIFNLGLWLLCGQWFVDHYGLAVLAVRRLWILKTSDLFAKQWCHKLYTSCQGLLLPPAPQLEMGPGRWWEQSLLCQSSALQWVPGTAVLAGEATCHKSPISPNWVVTEWD